MESFQACIGEIDGANRTFTTPLTFVAGSLRPLLNGQLVPEQLYLELSNQSFELQYPPLPGDQIVAFAKVAN